MIASGLPNERSLRKSSPSGLAEGENQLAVLIEDWDGLIQVELASWNSEGRARQLSES